MSLLQKSIRRGRTDLAQQAAVTLLRDSSDRLWRRLGVIAAEDIGLGGLCLLGQVRTALGKTTRKALGSDWQVANYLISTMASAPKCRAADDLLMVIIRHPALTPTRLELAYLDREELTGVVGGTYSLVERTIALLYLLGTDRGHVGHLLRRRGTREAAFEALNGIGCGEELLELAKELYRKSGEAICLFLPLLSREDGWTEKITANHLTPPEVMIGPVPSWAYDIFTREGRSVFARFLSGKTETARWIRRHVVPSARLEFLGNLVFYLEGGCLSQRLRWSVGDQLRELAQSNCLGIDSSAASEVFRLLPQDFPALNRLRRQIAGEARHVQ
jgi:hypothetical protein